MNDAVDCPTIIVVVVVVCRVARRRPERRRRAERSPTPRLATIVGSTRAPATFPRERRVFGGTSDANAAAEDHSSHRRVDVELVDHDGSPDDPSAASTTTP